MAADPQRRPSTGTLASEALWAGLTGFGGGLSVLGALRHRLVEKRRLLDAAEFARTAAVAQMLPGGAAVNAFGLLGLRGGGVPAALLATAAFLLPGFLAVLLLSLLWVRLGGGAVAAQVLLGCNAVVVAIVAVTAARLTTFERSRPWPIALALVAFLASAFSRAPPGAVVASGAAAGLLLGWLGAPARLQQLRRARTALGKSNTSARPPPAAGRAGPLRTPAPVAAAALAFSATQLLPLALVAAPALLDSAAAAELWRLGLLFLREGAGAFGGGFSVVPHLQAVLVEGGLLGERQFTEAVAIAKLTPGPVLLLATAVGYLRLGVPGALVATAGIFAVPLLSVLATGRLLERHRTRRAVRAALWGLVPSVVGLMAAAALTLARGLDGPIDWALAGIALLLLLRTQASPVLLLACGGALRALAAGILGW